MTAVLIALCLNAPLQYVDAVMAAAERINLDPVLACAVVEWESGFQPQIEPKWNKDGSNDYGLFGLNSRHNYQYRESIERHCALGAALLMGGIMIEGGDVRRGLSRYNTGGPVGEIGARYADKVLEIYDTLKEATR